MILCFISVLDIPSVQEKALVLYFVLLSIKVLLWDLRCVHNRLLVQLCLGLICDHNPL